MTDSLVYKPFDAFDAFQWDLLLDNFEVTVSYTAWFLNYVTILNKRTEIKNHTFMVYRGSSVIAIVPIFIEKIDGSWQMSIGQEPISALIFNKIIPQQDVLLLYQPIVKEIERLALEFQCILARFFYSPLLYREEAPNYLKQFGFVEEICYPDWYVFKAKSSYVIDLNNSIEALYKTIRKGHKANIKRTSPKVKLIVLDRSFFDQQLFEQYISLHCKIKGQNRSQAAFVLDRDAVRNGLEVILLCKFNGALVGSVALHTAKSKARYNSSVQDYSLTESIYPTHYLLWSAISYLKENGFSVFEIGEQVIESESYKISQKEKNLSHFKAGWGGRLVPSMKAQKDFTHV